MKRSRAFVPPLLLTAVVAVAASAQFEEQLSIHTLAPRDRLGGGGGGGGIHVADALLSDWEGDHWVSLDADLDKVSLSWTTDAEHVTFQVGQDANSALEKPGKASASNHDLCESGIMYSFHNVLTR